jgi:hypothetical protein
MLEAGYTKYIESRQVMPEINPRQRKLKALTYTVHKQATGNVGAVGRESVAGN